MKNNIDSYRWAQKQQMEETCYDDSYYPNISPKSLRKVGYKKYSINFYVVYNENNNVVYNENNIDDYKILHKQTIYYYVRFNNQKKLDTTLTNSIINLPVYGEYKLKEKISYYKGKEIVTFKNVLYVNEKEYKNFLRKEKISRLKLKL